MRRFLLVIALSGCAGSVVRAPKQLPADGIVDCTDTMDVPIARGVGAAVGAGLVALALTHIEFSAHHGGAFWVPVLGLASVQLLFGAMDSHASVLQCRDAKQRGAELAEQARRKADARAEAGVLWKRAAVAARADDCATVRELDPQIRDLDVELHDVVFARDVGIARCLATR
jgi:hypothetical protein